MHGDQIPHPLEDSDNSLFPRMAEGEGVKCPEAGGCWSFDLTDT